MSSLSSIWESMFRKRSSQQRASNDFLNPFFFVRLLNQNKNHKQLIFIKNFSDDLKGFWGFGVLGFWGV